MLLFIMVFFSILHSMFKNKRLDFIYFMYLIKIMNYYLNLILKPLCKALTKFYKFSADQLFFNHSLKS